MRTRTAYREKPAPEIPTEDEITQRLIEDTINPGERQLSEPPAPPAEPSDSVGAEAQAGDSEAVQQALQEQAEADAAKADLLNPDLALKRQLDALRAAEQMQRQRMAAPRIPRTPQELVAVWKAQGLTDREAQFLLDHQEMIARPDFIARAANEAQAQGVERDSDEYFATIKDSFDRQVAKRTEKKARKAAKKAHEPTPEYFQPTPAPPEQPSDQAQSAIYSAPVSRQARWWWLSTVAVEHQAFTRGTRGRSHGRH